MSKPNPIFLLPDASSISPHIDLLFWTFVIMSLLVAGGVMLAILYFGVRYHRGSKANRANRHRKNMTIEMSWTLIPFAIFLIMFVWSLFLYARLHTPPANAKTVYVVAKQWMWKIQHPGGQREINMLHVALGQPVRLTMTSQDVIHSFYVPSFRVKQDVLPNRYTRLWFTPTELGRFTLECAEYCGLDHSRMKGYVVVMRPAAFARWLHDHAGSAGIVAQGRKIFRERGCSGCHGPNASVHAPDLHGIFGRVVHLADGTSVVADSKYIHDSVMLPDSQVVAGYAPIMPSFKDQIPASDMIKLMAYLKSLKSVAHKRHPPIYPTDQHDDHHRRPATTASSGR